MNKYMKACKYLREEGCEASLEGNKVSVLVVNKDTNNRYWLYISEVEVDIYSGRYDSAYGGYAMLSDMKAWADKQRESDIIGLSFDELVHKYNKENS